MHTSDLCIQVTRCRLGMWCAMLIVVCLSSLFDLLSLRHDNTTCTSSTKLRVEMLHKKLKKDFLRFSVLHFSVQYFTGLREDVSNVFLTLYDEK